MINTSEHIGGGDPNGGIYNFIAELPDWMSAKDVGVALVEIDANVRGIRTPPVASVDLTASEATPLDDYRKFYVAFEEEATGHDIVAAVRIVANAIHSYRRAGR